eukprot:COSAG01_NODE_13639_length_1554_cov_8.675601_2_plen_291_part_00
MRAWAPALRIVLTLIEWLLEMSDKVPCTAVFRAGPGPGGGTSPMGARRPLGAGCRSYRSSSCEGRRAASSRGPATLRAALVRGASVGRPQIDVNGSRCKLGQGHQRPWAGVQSYFLGGTSWQPARGEGCLYAQGTAATARRLLTAATATAFTVAVASMRACRSTLWPTAPSQDGRRTLGTCRANQPRAPPFIPSMPQGAMTAGGAAPNLQYMGTVDIAASWMRCGWSVPQHDRGAGQQGRDRAGLDGHNACIIAGCTSNLPHTCTQVGAAHLRQVHCGGGSLEMHGSLGQ